MLRLILVFIIIVLIVRAFVITGIESRKREASQRAPEEKWKFRKGVPGEIGEYIDFEEIGKRK